MAISTYFKFESLAPETRNEIYKLVLADDRPVKITSPHRRKRRSKSNNFLALTLLNKALGKDAKATFYSINTFVFGNGRYGSTVQANLHGLKCFIQRVPKECLPLIRKIKLHLFFTELPDSRDPNSNYEMNHLDIKELKAITRAIFKHLKGVQDVLTEPRKLWRDLGPVRGLGDYAGAVKPILVLPALKNIEFKDENYLDWYEMKELVYRKGVESMNS